MKLYRHQKDQLKFHLTHPNSANFSEMGTGKTVVALAYAEVLHNVEMVSSVLVTCPLSVLHTWELEIRKHTILPYISVVGDLENKIKLLKKPSFFYLISYDSIPGRKGKKFDTYGQMLRALIDKNFDLLIGDEISMIKGYGSLRTKAVTLLCDLTPFTLFLDGSPIAGNPSDLFNIYRALDGGHTFGRNFFAIRNKYFKNVGYGFPKWELKEEMLDAYKEKMFSIAVRARKDECLDLPPKIFSPRFGDLSNEQKILYIPIVEELLMILELDEGTVKIHNAMNKISKLSQITSGFLYTDEDPHYFKDNPKLSLLEEVLSEAKEEKVIIYGYWQEDMKLISQFLKDKKYDYRMMYGATTQADRSNYIDDFQKGNTQILLSNIGVGGYGLTLTASSTIIYYDFSFKTRDFIQSQDRIHRIGQAKTCLYLPLFLLHSIDEYIYSKLIGNISISDSIVDGKDLKETLSKFMGGRI